MTKQEIIKEAYGDTNYEMLKSNISESGWVSENVVKRSNFNSLEFDVRTNSMRPLKLKGLETNNGWNSILSESDLPNDENILYHYYDIRVKNRMLALNVKLGSFSCDELKNLYLADICTHYRKVDIIEPPFF